MPNIEPTILVVHNEEREASELQALLERNIGCKTSATWSGLEALKLLEAGHFDVLVTDDYVPDLFVGDLIERAAALPLPLQVLVLGEHPALDAIGRCQSLGLCTILDKQRPRAILQAISARSVWKGPGTPVPTKSSVAASSQATNDKQKN